MLNDFGADFEISPLYSQLLPKLKYRKQKHRYETQDVGNALENKQVNPGFPARCISIKLQ